MSKRKPDFEAALSTSPMGFDRPEPDTPVEQQGDQPSDAPPVEPPASHPALDREQAIANALAVLVRQVGSSDFRIVRRKVKVGGVWYVVEVARP